MQPHQPDKRTAAKPAARELSQPKPMEKFNPAHAGYIMPKPRLRTTRDIGFPWWKEPAEEPKRQQQY